MRQPVLIGLLGCLPLLIGCSSSSDETDNDAAGINAGGAGTGGSGGDLASAGSGGDTTALGGAGGVGGDAGGSGGEGGAPEVGGAGGAANGGTGGIPVDENGDQIPWRELQVTAPPDEYRFGFRPSEADPLAVQQDNIQAVGLDTRVPMIGKLVIDLGFNGGVYYDWLVQRGFHVFGADFAGVEEVPDLVGQSADFYGEVRLEALEGVDHTDAIDINYHDSLEGHVTEGLKYLHDQFPDQDWGYYLNQDGSVRWSDVIVTGLSHGATSAARWGMVRRLSRVVSSSGPRDNTCGTDPTCATGIVATWLSETPKTPIDRFYAITGALDSQYPEILYTMEKLGYVGPPVNVQEVAPPYNGSHRLTTSVGHQRFCGEGAQWDDVCNYMFGVPVENQ